jgi:hypothetical protein
MLARASERGCGFAHGLKQRTRPPINTLDNIQLGQYYRCGGQQQRRQAK